MEIETLKSNYKAIQRAKKVPVAKKRLLAATLLDEIELIFLKDPTYGSTEEKSEAQTLYKEVIRYLNLL